MNDEPTRIQLSQSFVPSGTRLSGIYEIDAPLAKGGMGEVYRGHTIETGDPVAIKVIRSDMADNDSVLALFRREASALSRLHHEAIIRYFVFSLDPGLQRHYLAMELVEGDMLSTIVSRGPLPPASVARLMTRLASGLQAAHERGIIHRDLSPDNVIIEGGMIERARIIDFGIARSTRIGDTTVIGSGFAGKYNYVSPEQLGLFGGEVTGRSDIYSLGLVMAQCLLGRALDMGGSQVDVVEKRRHVPDLTGIDGSFRPLLERMLQPDPANRPADMAEVIGWRIDTQDVTARPVPEKRSAAKPEMKEPHAGSSRKLVVAIALGGLLLAGGSVAFLQFFSDGWVTPPPQPTPSIERPPALSPSLAPPPQAQLPSPPPIASPAADVEQSADRFIRDFDGGDCFLALPTALSPTSAEIDAFGIDRRGFDALDTGFTKSLGFEAMIDGGQVTQAQCPALRFLTDLRRKAQAKPARLEIARTSIKSNDTLTGSLLVEAPSIAMLSLDHQGRVTDMTSQLASADGGKRFSLRVVSSEPGRPRPMLLIAVASTQRIASLRGAEAMSQGAMSAAIRDAAAQGEGVFVAAKYFKVE